MIKKSPVKGSDKVSVTFETVRAGATSVALVGDFNDWNPVAHPMKQRKDGTWSIALRLPKSRDWQYQFVVNGSQWVVDEDTDGTTPNPYGGVNAVVLT